MIKKSSCYSIFLLLSIISISSYSGVSRLAETPGNFKDLIPTDTYILGLNGKVEKYTITRNSRRSAKSKSVYIFDKRGYIINQNTFKSGKLYLSVKRISAEFNKDSVKLKYKEIYYKSRRSARKMEEEKVVIWKRGPNNGWQQVVNTGKSMSPTKIINTYTSNWTPVSSKVTVPGKIRRAQYQYNSRKHLTRFEISNSSGRRRSGRGSNITYDFQHNGDRVNAKVTYCARSNRCSRSTEKTLYSEIDKNKNYLKSVHFSLKRPELKTRTVRTFQYF